MKDLLLAGGAIFVLLYVHKQQQAAVAPSHSMNPTNQNTPATNMPVIGGGGGGSSLDVGGGGFLGGGGGGFNPADLAWQFADWVDSIQVGGYPQITGVIGVPAEHTSIDEHMNQ